MIRQTQLATPWIGWAVLLCMASTVNSAETKVLQLWPDGAPGETGQIPPEEAITSGEPAVTRIHNVSDPTIQLHLASKGKANGCAVVVCPGGAYNILAYDKEGTEVADWLNSLGVTAVVLKYRVPRRDKQQPHTAPLQDVQRAIRMTRASAESWQIDPDRIGVLGFSAGGHLTVMAGTHWGEKTYEAIDEADRSSCRPDFLVPIYPAYLGDPDDPDRLSPLVNVTKDMPPTFIAITYDDKDRAIFAALLFVALKKAGIPAELHVYAKGGHGYGLRPSDNPVSNWPKRCEAWLRVSGFLDRQNGSESDPTPTGV